MRDLAEPVADIEEVVSRLNAAAPRLRALGVQSLTVFGSFVDGAPTGSSDVDFVVSPRPATFRKLIEVEDALADIMMRDVDVLTPAAVKPYLRERIERTGRRVAL
ncbi:MAG: nucleotidyltransferase domain-containing protein [Oceanicaulis sp.]